MGYGSILDDKPLSYGIGGISRFFDRILVKNAFAVGEKMALLKHSQEVVHFRAGEIEFSPPEPFKPRRICRRVNDGVLNVPVSQIVVNEPRNRILVGQGEAASVAQHVRVSGQKQPGQLATGADRGTGGCGTNRSRERRSAEPMLLRQYT